MCATPSYIIVNNEQDDNTFSFDLNSDRNNELQHDTQKITNNHEYLQSNDCMNSLANRDNTNFLDRDEITQDEKPLHFLDMRRQAKAIEEQVKLSYQNNTFESNEISLSNSFITNDKANEGNNFDSDIASIVLEHDKVEIFNDELKSIERTLSNTERDMTESDLVNSFVAPTSTKIYDTKKNIELLCAKDNHCVNKANGTDDGNVVEQETI